MNTPKWYTEQEVLFRVKEEVELSTPSVEKFRSQYIANKEQFDNHWDKIKIYDKSIKTLTTIAQAIHAKNEVEVDFATIGDQPNNRLVQWLQALAERDFTDNNRLLKNKQKVIDSWISGVAIEMQSWNKELGINEQILMSPEEWVFSHYNINTGFEYQGFEIGMTKTWLAASGYLDEDIMSRSWEKREKWIEKELWSTKWATRESLMRTAKDMFNSLEEESTFGIYIHFTRFRGIPYRIVTANNHSMLLSCDEIKGVTKKQKKNPRTIQYPITVTRAFFNADKTTGDTIFDLVGDKQRAREELANLNLYKVKESTMWGDIVYDINAISNGADLQRPKKTWLRYIWADFSKTNGTPFYKLPQDQMSQDAYNMPDMLQGEMFYNSGYDKAMAWVTSEAGITATENIRAQKNANLLTINKEDFLAVYDIDFYRKWLEQYARAGKWVFKVPTNVGNVYMEVEVKATEIVAILDSVIVKPKSVTKREQDNKWMFAQMFYGVLRQNAKTESTKYRIDKWMMESKGLNTSDVEELLDEPMELIQWQLDIAMINNGEEVKREIDVINDDHMSYLTMLRTAKDNIYKRKEIQRRLLAQVQKEQYLGKQQQQWEEAGMGNNAMQNIAMAQSMQQDTNTKKAPSSLDVKI